MKKDGWVCCELIGGPQDGLQEYHERAYASIKIMHNGAFHIYKKDTVTTMVAASGTVHSATYQYEGPG